LVQLRVESRTLSWSVLSTAGANDSRKEDRRRQPPPLIGTVSASVVSPLPGQAPTRKMACWPIGVGQVADAVVD
jgi:hypothetical protein